MLDTIFNPNTVKLYRPPLFSHKGQNGKLLVIGGSKLFHSSIFWSADVASRIVDVVHFTSPANENNEVVRKRIKEGFWSGIVVDWGDVEDYIEEDDCVLIGPGMIRNKVAQTQNSKFKTQNQNLNLKTAVNTDHTSFIVDYLLKKFPTKKWIIDGGALQEVEPGLITESCILTPHRKEFEGLIKRSHLRVRQGETLSEYLKKCTILLKGQTDIVYQGNKCIEIYGGNSGMTKGGTGDVLAGLVAALYCKNDAWTAATVGSWVNKTAGDQLYKKVGPYFNASDLLQEIPKVLWEIQDDP